jgi:hypothetical protein
MKERGSQFEREVVKYLKDHGFPFAERAYGAGRNDDRGDIDGLPGVVMECKAQRTSALSEWVKEAETERVNAEAAFGIVVHKRFGRHVSDSYCTLPLWQLANLLVGAWY